MKHFYLINKKGVFFLLIILLFTIKQGYAQLIYQPYSYQFYQKLNTAEYSPDTRLHTAVKPYFIADSGAVRHVYDSLMTAGGDPAGKSWLHRALFNNHGVDIKNKDYTFYADYLTDVQAGREFIDKQTTYLNTRGYQAGGTVGENFFFYTSGYEDQGKFANYEAAYIRNTSIVPGQAYDRTFLGYNDWSYVTALIGYKPSKAITIALGEDKTFIGDGYRSVLLSDYASPYPLLRITADLGKNVQYMALWAYFEDPNAVQFNAFSNNRRKWGAFHYIDWNITNRASIGFFNAIIDEEADNQGNLHGFDVNYINPVLFSSSLGPASPVPDHTLLGFNGKYKVFDKTTIYGQLLFDQALSPLSSSSNAWQLGFKGSDLFKVNRLNYLFEYNTATPYTYANQNPIVNYSQLAEPLADPLGANFKEWVGIINYSIGKFDLQGQVNYAKYGLNIGNTNYGKDIILASNINLPPLANGTTGQGLATTLRYAEGTVAYLLNPTYNFRIEAGALLRDEKNSQTDTKTVLITIGLRSSFRNLYHDF